MSDGTENETTWNYEPGEKGPANWPNLFPTCKDQQNGSPINIDDADTVLTQFEQLKFNYRKSQANVTLLYSSITFMMI